MLASISRCGVQVSIETRSWLLCWRPYLRFGIHVGCWVPDTGRALKSCGWLLRSDIGWSLSCGLFVFLILFGVSLFGFYVGFHIAFEWFVVVFLDELSLISSDESCGWLLRANVGWSLGWRPSLVCVGLYDGVFGCRVSRWCIVVRLLGWLLGLRVLLELFVKL